MRLLVVEDERRLADSLRTGFEAEGFAVDVAYDGGEGLWLAQENDYDAVVLDIMLPVLNGYKVCERLREAKVWTPILMLTAKDGEWDEIEALDTGADDYVTKPFHFQVLLARLRSLLRRGARERPTVLSAGDLAYDPATKELTRAGEVLRLTSRELAMIELFLRRAGDVVTKQQILDNIWDHAFDGDPNIVEVYVARLRKKLDRAGDPPHIETLRGSGYRLVRPEQDDG